jgi:hypothetical protein
LFDDQGRRAAGPVLEREMSETLESEAIAQALEVIDRHLATLNRRELVSTAEVSDLLLDMRSILASPDLDLESLETVAPARN